MTLYSVVEPHGSALQMLTLIHVVCVSKVLVEEVVPFLNNVCYWEGYMAPFARQLDFETLVPVCTHWHSCVYIISE